MLHNFRPDQDLILIRSEHPVLKRATTVAGMSGSPIYLKGKLAGAYAYGWLFGKEPIAGVTPAATINCRLPISDRIIFIINPPFSLYVSATYFGTRPFCREPYLGDYFDKLNVDRAIFKYSFELISRHFLNLPGLWRRILPRLQQEISVDLFHS